MTELQSRTAFLARFPFLFDQLPPYPSATPILPNAAEVAVALVDSYWKQPARIVLGEPFGENLYSESGRVFKHSVIGACRDLGATPETLAAQPDYRGGTLVVFGIGLGFHLAPLIERTGARQVMIVEPDVTLLGAALAAVDWQALFERHERQGCRFSLIMADSAATIADTVLSEIAKRGEIFLDGAWLFVHPPFPAALFTAVGGLIREKYKPLLIVQGNCRDECLMIANSFENLRMNRFRLLDAGRQSTRSEPVFIIGSGPSLDGDAADIKRLRDRCLVFTCGSALQACLGHGIRPDFHVELENHPLILDIIAHAARTYDLAGITLIASLTIDPRVPPLFERSVMYFRHRTVPAYIFGAKTYEMSFAAPTVTNVALRVAISFGFTNFYLFGTDLGTRRVDKIHADDTAYRDIPLVSEVEKEFNFSIDAPGNFGGIVKTDAMFFAPAQRNIEALIRLSGVSVRNCSDGVRIAGARPLKAKGLRLPVLPMAHEAIREQVLQPYRPLVPGEGLTLIDLEQVIRDRTRAFDALDAVLDRAEPDENGIIDVWERIQPFCDAEAYAGTTLLYSRELKSAVRFATFFLVRITDPDRRHGVFRRVLTAVRSLLTALRAQSEGAIS